jgi:iron complex transport system substrate-binding protein
MKRFILICALCISFFSCGNRGHKTADNPQRIVSLSPAITQQIIDLNEERRLVGVTSYHPSLSKKVTIVGTLNNPSIEMIISLKPDIVLFSKEDSNTQKIDALAQQGIAFYRFSRNRTFNEIAENYKALGKLLHSKVYKEKLQRYRKQLKGLPHITKKVRIAVMIAHSPLIPAGRTSYINDMIEKAGGINAFNDLNRPYPPISLEIFVERNPDIIISIEKNPEKRYRRLLKNFKSLKVIKHPQRFFYVDPQIAALYSPANFVTSAKIISSILIGLQK